MNNFKSTPTAIQQQKQHNFIVQITLKATPYSVGCPVQLIGEIFTSVEREVKDSRRLGMSQSCFYLVYIRLGTQSL